MKVVAEAHVDDWVIIGEVNDISPPASLSSAHPKRGRQVYCFGWLEGDGPGVWRSNGGVDVEEGVGRIITAVNGFTKLADLRDGRHQRIIYTKYGPKTFRFTAVDGV